jgi:hypothetical protein
MRMHLHTCDLSGQLLIADPVWMCPECGAPYRARPILPIRAGATHYFFIYDRGGMTTPGYWVAEVPGRPDPWPLD